MKERNSAIPLSDGTVDALWGLKSIEFPAAGGVIFVFSACRSDDPFLSSNSIDIRFIFSIAVYSWKLTGESSIMGNLPVNIKEGDRSNIYEVENSDYRDEIYKNSCELQGDARSFIIISNEDILEVIATDTPEITRVETSVLVLGSTDK